MTVRHGTVQFCVGVVEAFITTLLDFHSSIVLEVCNSHLTDISTAVALLEMLSLVLYA